MSKRNLYLEITNSIWLIDQSYAASQFQFINSLLNGHAPDLEIKSKAKVDTVGGNADSSEQNTAIIFVSGPIMKYDNCGAAGTKTLVAAINSLKNNPQISSIVMVCDSPGGTVSGTEEFAAAVKEAAAVKPFISLVDGTCASAMYWAASGSTAIYALNKTAMIGSIGTMLSFADMQAVHEKEGAIFHEIYADASVDKNKDFSEARKKNYEGVKQTLNAINDIFVSSVTESRGDKLNKKETLSGKMFMAEDAVKVGLIDGFASLEEVIQIASNQSITNNNLTNPNMKIKASFVSIVAFLASAFSFKADDTVLTDEHMEKINSELATLEQVKAEKEKAIAEKDQAIADLKNAQQMLDSASTSLVVKTNELEALKKSNPGVTTTLKQGTDKIETAEADEFLTSVDRERAANEARGII